MKGISELVTGLAVYPGVEVPVVGQLSQSYAQVVVDRILVAAGMNGSGSSDLKDGVDQAISTADYRAWCPELGAANALFDLGGGFVDAALLQSIAMVCCWGWTGEIERRLPHPVTLAFGPCRLRCCGRTRIAATRDAVVVTTDDGSYALSRLGTKLWLDGAPTLVFTGANGLAIAAGHRVDPEVLRAEDVPVSLERFGDASASVEQALSLLTAGNGDARAWVDRVTRVISLVAPQPDGATSSRSLATRPGNILVTAPIDPLALAEALVHEAAHQYYALCGRLGGFVREERRDELFFSAINGLQRPIGKLALALHALANMCVLYDEVLSRGGDVDRFALPRLTELASPARSLADTVSANRDAFLPHVLGFIDAILATVHRVGCKYQLPCFAGERTALRLRESA